MLRSNSLALPENEDHSLDELTNDNDNKDLPPFIEHQVIKEVKKFIIIVKKIKGLKCFCEVILSDFIKVTVTMELEQSEIEALAKSLKLAPTTVQNYFPPLRERYIILFPQFQSFQPVSFLSIHLNSFV
jgi:hypothetical protein